MKRRQFIKTSGTTTGGLLLMLNGAWNKVLGTPLNGHFKPNLFLEISPDNWTTFIITKQEIGQGSTTGISQIIADELGVDWDKIAIQYADGDQVFGDLQDTGGSNSILQLWQPVREAAATTREILIRAAAKKWAINPEQLDARESHVFERNGARKIPFGDLTQLALEIPIPATVSYRKTIDYQFIGKPMVGHRVKEIVQGKLPYGINVKIPGMVYATIERAPVYGGTIKSYNDAETRKIPGVIEVIKIDGNEQEPNVFLGGVRQGVAVIATDTWSALKGKAALEIDWDNGEAIPKDGEALKLEFDELAKEEREISFESGDPALANQAARTLNATYENPYQVNACMEPLNATAHFKDGACEIWAGTQSPQMTRTRIAKVLELEESKVTVHHHPAGGGFGRRYYTDFVEEAALLSEAMGRPVQLVWSREDTLKTSRYHPFRMDYYTAKINGNNEVVSLNFSGRLSQPGGYRALPYQFPHIQYTPIRLKSEVLPFTSWRSVYAHIWGFGLESFIDELAHAVGEDPLQFRLNLLGDHRVIDQKGPWTKDQLYVDRLKNTLTRAADKVGWGKKMPKNRGIGLSTFHYNTSYCSQAADVSVEDGKLTIHKIVCVLDCGQVINPSLVKGQMEGSIIWALTALLKSQITLENGLVVQNNYHDYPMLRIDEVPEIEVHLIENEVTPGGSGEQAVPGLAPAVLNAIFAATGKRIRKLPVLPEDLA